LENKEPEREREGERKRERERWNSRRIGVIGKSMIFGLEWKWSTENLISKPPISNLGIA
jgi:hypothetical protein